MRIVVSLFDETQFLSVLLIKPRIGDIDLLQTLQGQDQQLRVVLVRQRRKGDRRELSGLQPVDSCGIDGNGLLGADVWAVLEKIVLALLLGFQPQTSQSSEVFLK